MLRLGKYIEGSDRCNNNDRWLPRTFDGKQSGPFGR
jgi:hypothetical protein